jgi:multiple sugar transport system permease protein
MSAVTHAYRWRASRRRIGPGRLLAWLALAVAVVATLLPFYWLLRTSVTERHAVLSGDQSLLPPHLTLANFRGVLNGSATPSAGLNFLVALRNTLIVATLVTVGQVTFSASSAYAFARLRFPGRDRLFALYLAALMVPPIFTILPNFVLMKDLGWLNTFQGIAAPTFLMTPFAVFFMRQFFLGISRELEDAARIDGASRATIFLRVVLPISQAPLFTLALVTFITAWNDYLWPLIVGQGEHVRVLTVALSILRAQYPGGQPDWAVLMAGTVLAMAPIFLLVIALRRRLVDAIQFTGLK